MSDVDFGAIREDLEGKPPQLLHCYCCGETYPRGRFRCCAAPNGMPSHEWAEQSCTGCKRCRRHCGCQGAPVPVTSLAEWLERAKGAVAHRSVVDIFEEGERDEKA